jgi:hypothetical protein
MVINEEKGMGDGDGDGEGVDASGKGFRRGKKVVGNEGNLRVYHS